MYVIQTFVWRCSSISASDEDDDDDNYGVDNCGASNGGCVDVEHEAIKPPN
jgi:hypothetical protein